MPCTHCVGADPPCGHTQGRANKNRNYAQLVDKSSDAMTPRNILGPVAARSTSCYRQGGMCEAEQ
jgi:hypothetical protein